jgi:hypothetical protein
MVQLQVGIVMDVEASAGTEHNHRARRDWLGSTCSRLVVLPDFVDRKMQPMTSRRIAEEANRSD